MKKLVPSLSRDVKSQLKTKDSTIIFHSTFFILHLPYPKLIKSFKCFNFIAYLINSAIK